MNLIKYKICNLLNYQVNELKKLVGESAVSTESNSDKPYFYNICIGLNSTEVAILQDLGFVLNKIATVGVAVENANG